MPVPITDDQRINLAKLATFLEANARGVAARFDMELFNQGSELPSDRFEQSVSNCGTAGCAVGWGPNAGVMPMPLEDWIDYSGRAFAWVYSNEWDYMFSDDWARTDNTPAGAAARIRLILDKGLPEFWAAEMHGNAPLSYKIEEAPTAA